MQPRITLVTLGVTDLARARAFSFSLTRRSALLDFCFHAHDRFGAVGETDARAAVGRGQDVCFGDQRAELGGAAAVGANGRCL